MTKADLIEGIHQTVGLARSESGRIVEKTLDVIKRTLETGEKVKISGFGTFEVRHKKARKGRNPKTAETIILPAHRVVVFKASHVLRKSLNRAA
ncbi:MAG: integration host factor subunit alpha [Nitrospirae bacterium]|nr:integration host factor subunit alpha [Nitrospirota bacterium]